jgi:hypothetical protein
MRLVNSTGAQTQQHERAQGGVEHDEHRHDTHHDERDLERDVRHH